MGFSATLAFARSSNPEDELFVVRFNDDVQNVIRDRQFLLFGGFVGTLTFAVSFMGQFVTFYLIDKVGVTGTGIQLMLLVAGGSTNAALYNLTKPPGATVSVTVNVTMAAVAPGGTAITLLPAPFLPSARLITRVSLAPSFAPALSRES